MANPERTAGTFVTTAASAEPTRGVTVRSVLSGLVLVVALDALAIHLRYVVHGSLMTYSHVPMAMLIVFTLMIVVGALIARFSPWKLSSPEWHTILAMGIVGAAVPGFGLSGYLLGYIATPYYFATEVNEWHTYLHPYINPWLIPSDENKAVTWFFEGAPKGAQIPWDAWLLPLLWWTTFIMAAFVVLACVAVVFRRQWVQNERLAFPAMAPLIHMAEAPGSGRFALPDFTKNYLFWIGFGLAFGMIAWNCINYFLPGFPRFPVYRGRWYWIDRQYPPAFGFLGLFTIFFSYFASLDVLFSIWFFDLLFIVEGGWLHRRGFTAISPYYYRGVYYWQTKGAFAMLAASVFWVARRHIRDVLRKAWNRDHPMDDRDEPLSCRTAVVAMLVGLAFMWLWLSRIGFDPLLAALLLPAVIFTYVGLAKILAETGMPYTNVPAARGVSYRLSSGHRTSTKRRESPSGSHPGSPPTSKGCSCPHLHTPDALRRACGAAADVSCMPLFWPFWSVLSRAFCSRSNWDTGTAPTISTPGKSCGRAPNISKAPRRPSRTSLRKNPNCLFTGNIRTTWCSSAWAAWPRFC